MCLGAEGIAVQRDEQFGDQLPVCAAHAGNEASLLGQDRVDLADGLPQALPHAHGGELLLGLDHSALGEQLAQLGGERIGLARPPILAAEESAVVAREGDRRRP